MSDVPAIILPREDEIRKLILGGHHPVTIARIITNRGFPITPEAVNEYKKSLEQAPEPSALRKFLDFDRVTDALQDAHHLVLIEEERVVQLLKEEKESGQVRPATNAYINQTFRHLKELAELEYTLGVSPHQSTAQTSEQPRTLQTVRELLEAARGKTVTLREMRIDG